jgi:hypothetical protein
MNNLVYEIMKYFAQFPAIAGVQKFFHRQSSIYPDYATLKTAIETGTNSRLPSIGDYVFGSDEEILSKYIKTIKGKYLMVEIGTIDMQRNRYDNFENYMNISIVVAENIDVKSRDGVERAIVMQSNLTLLQQIIRFMNADEYDYCANIQFPDSGVIIPVEPFDMLQSAGWLYNFKWKDNTLFI